VAKQTDIQAEFTILSEFGMLGLEMGYSLENPNTLVQWEALPHGYMGQGA